MVLTEISLEQNHLPVPHQNNLGTPYLQEILTLPFYLEMSKEFLACILHMGLSG